MLMIMNIFNIIAGTASIVSLVISVISLCKVSDIQKNINKSDQQMKESTIEHNSTVIQVGRDYKQK